MPSRFSLIVSLKTAAEVGIRWAAEVRIDHALNLSRSQISPGMEKL